MLELGENRSRTQGAPSLSERVPCFLYMRTCILCEIMIGTIVAKIMVLCSESCTNDGHPSCVLGRIRAQGFDNGKPFPQKEVFHDAVLDPYYHRVHPYRREIHLSLHHGPVRDHSALLRRRANATLRGGVERPLRPPDSHVEERRRTSLDQLRFNGEFLSDKHQRERERPYSPLGPQETS